MCAIMYIAEDRCAAQKNSLGNLSTIYRRLSLIYRSVKTRSQSEYSEQQAFGKTKANNNAK